MGLRSIHSRWVVGIIMTIVLSALGSPVFADGLTRQRTESFQGYYVTTKTQWEQLKSELTLPVEVRALNPNFAKETLILAYWGQKPSAGYRINIDSLEIQGEEAVVQVAMAEPEKGSFTASVITYPTAFRQVEVAQMAKVKRVIFQDSQGALLDQVMVSPQDTYTVQVGDTLWKVARTLGQAGEGEIMDFVHQVIIWNNLTDAQNLIPGAKLIVPGSRVSLVTAPTYAEDKKILGLLKEEISQDVVGFWPEEQGVLVQEASSRYTALQRVQLEREPDGHINLVDQAQITAYTSAGPWVKDDSGQIICDLREVEGANVVNYLSLSPDQRYLAIGARGYRNLLLIWDIAEESFLEVERYPNELVSMIVWSPDSRYLTTQLAGVWGRSRIKSYTVSGETAHWDPGQKWPLGYNLEAPRWLGYGAGLTFNSKPVGAATATSESEGEWVCDPVTGQVSRAEDEMNLL